MPLNLTAALPSECLCHCRKILTKCVLIFMIGVAIVTPSGIEERYIDENGGSDEICVVKRNGMVSIDGLTVLLIFTSSPAREPIAGNDTLSPIKDNNMQLPIGFITNRL